VREQVKAKIKIKAQERRAKEEGKDHKSAMPMTG
jgi:hypothetical protein